MANGQDQQPYSLEDALYILSRIAQSRAPTSSQRGYVRSIEDIFSPQVAAIADPTSVQTKLPTQLTQNELIELYAPDLFLYGTDSQSLEAGVLRDIMRGNSSLLDVNKKIRAGYNAEIDRLLAANPDLTEADTPTLEDYLGAAKNIYTDYQTVKAKEKEQSVAFADAQKKGDIFQQAGLPKPSEKYLAKDFFKDQLKEAEGVINKRLASTPGLMEATGVSPYGPSIEASKRADEANQAAQNSARQYRESLMQKLETLAQQKLDQSGRTPFLDAAIKRLTVGR